MSTETLIRAAVALRRALPWTENLDEPRLAVLVRLVEQDGCEGLHRRRDLVEAVYCGAWHRAAALLEDEALATQMRTGTWQV